MFRTEVETIGHLRHHVGSLSWHGKPHVPSLQVPRVAVIAVHSRFGQHPQRPFPAHLHLVVAFASYAQTVQQFGGSGTETRRMGVVEKVAAAFAFHPDASVGILLHRGDRVVEQLAQLLVIRFRKTYSHLMPIVAVHSLRGAHPEIAVAVCQQTRHGIAAQTVANAQSSECRTAEEWGLSLLL